MAVRFKACRCLFLCMSALLLGSTMGAVDWEKGLDRTYMAAEVLPEIGRIVGATDNVLEVGVMPYNMDDCVRANVSGRQWFFVDYFTRPIPPQYGSFTEGSMASVLKDTTKIHFFKVVYDYGVLGFTPKRWGDYPVTVHEHIAAYPKLLKRDGLLFLKFDLHWPTENIDIWPTIRRKLVEYLEPVSSFLQVKPGCPAAFKERLWKMEKDNFYSESMSFDFTGQGKIPTGGCDAYLYMVWRNSLPRPERRYLR